MPKTFLLDLMGQAKVSGKKSPFASNCKMTTWKHLVRSFHSIVYFFLRKMQQLALLAGFGNNKRGFSSCTVVVLRLGTEFYAVVLVSEHNYPYV